MVENEAARKQKLRELVRKYPDDALRSLLETPFWPQGLEVQEAYQRFGDDDASFLRVIFSPDGDVWPYVFQLEMRADPEFLASPRYRTYFGDGQSLRTRAALLMLAKAIALDNEERPQRRQDR